MWKMFEVPLVEVEGAPNIFFGLSLEAAPWASAGFPKKLVVAFAEGVPNSGFWSLEIVLWDSVCFPKDTGVEVAESAPNKFFDGFLAAVLCDSAGVELSEAAPK